MKALLLTYVLLVPADGDLALSGLKQDWRIGNIGKFVPNNPLAAAWNLKSLTEDKVGYVCLCVKVRNDKAIVAQVRQIERASSVDGRSHGLVVLYSRVFVVKGLDVSKMKDKSVWQPEGKFHVIGTERNKAGELFYVIEQVKLMSNDHYKKLQEGK